MPRCQRNAFDKPRTNRVKAVSKHMEKQDSMCIQQQPGPIHAWLKIVPYCKSEEKQSL